jgi:DNA-binding transcriptional ArsR family regulator
MDMAPELFTRLAERFTALGDANRLRMLQHLKAGPSRVADLAAAVGLSQPSVSKHLSTLRKAGLVSCERVGNEARYAVRDAMLFQLCELVCTSVRDQFAADADALGLTTTPNT